MGGRPCPCCKVRKKDIYLLGTEEDMEQRISGRRIDDEERWQRVEEARSLIYNSGYAVDNNKYVEALLKGESLVPTKVSSSAEFIIQADRSSSERVFESPALERVQSSWTYDKKAKTETEADFNAR
jgi:hypothetical protein